MPLHSPPPVPGQFLPGAIVAGRYRMIGLLGRGGMGEVYRADDLKLGQAVALKFLPADVERDPERLERFLTEVRMSLRVTHPNVCRVFDIGQIEERLFLSMEYVDGEDLASLLRRIGRLPEDKAVEIARQLCAGLAAAHGEGVLHRDLKPANIMIDGRGRAKIADFGLAGGAEGISGQEARVGTPQYMAPEQVAGGALTERTDIYALGLVLYELFTGKRAFEIKDLDDLQRLSSSTPTSPSSHVSGLNPLVERAILRCLEVDPAKRPSSATALAAAMPGGDPLAMAIAAGDTPSPEMVAAAGSDAGLRPAIAWPLLAAALAGGVILALISGYVAVMRVGAPVKPPDVLIERAREILRTIGPVAEPQDHAWGLSADVDFLNHVEARRPTDPRDRLATRGVTFWYRESPVLLERFYFLGGPELLPRVALTDPPLRYSGDAILVLDREGRLLMLDAVPSQISDTAKPTPDVNWSALFVAAGLDPSAWTPSEPRWTPQFHADRRLAWTPRDGTTTSPMRVEAGSFQGRPVSFHLIFPWTRPARVVTTRRTPAERVANLVSVLIFTAIMLGSGWVAHRNLRLDRADRRGALRLGIFTAAVFMGIWIVDEHHVPSIWELYLFLMAAGWALFAAALLAACYLALEPYVRRTWPAMIISWSRIFGGALRDPLVARDVLIGCAVAGVLGTVQVSGLLATRAVTGVLPRLILNQRPFLGVRYALSQLALDLVSSIFYALFLLFALFVIRRIVRNEWIAIVVGALILGVPFAVGDTASLANVPFGVVVQALIFVTLARVGLVATITAQFLFDTLLISPFTMPPVAWYSGVGFVGLAVTALLAIAAFRISTGSRAVASGLTER
jgi:serine/threonine-protein kinase